MKKTLREVAKDRIIILDGAMGTMIQQYGLETVRVVIEDLAKPNVTNENIMNN